MGYLYASLQKVGQKTKMSEQKYTEVFEFIKSNLIPKNQFDVSQNEILVLKSALENATNDIEKLKLEFQEQKMTIDIIKAERESLEAEKKAFEVKFNEVSLKLKQKTYQYDTLLKSKPNDGGEIEKKSACTQTVKEEPKEIGVVNVPSSSSSLQDESAVKTGAKRMHPSNDEVRRTAAKRKKTSKPDSNSRITRKSKPIYSCENCLEDWGYEIKWDHGGNPDESSAPDPKQEILTFSNIMDFENHLFDEHGSELTNPMCDENRCYSRRNCEYDTPHGDIRCRICDTTFRNHGDYEKHLQCEHADLNKLSKKQIYKLFLKYMT